MRGKVLFLGGLAAGFVVGARAGRASYDKLVETAHKVKESPSLQEATGVVQDRATRLYTGGKAKVAGTRLAETRLGKHLLSTPPSDVPADEAAGGPETPGSDTGADAAASEATAATEGDAPAATTNNVSSTG